MSHSDHYAASAPTLQCAPSESTNCASTPPPPTEQYANLPTALNAVIMKALEKDRDLRCQTAAEMRADLKRIKRDSSSGKTGTAPGSASIETHPGPSQSPPPSQSLAAPGQAPSSGSVLLGDAKQHRAMVAGGIILAVIVVAAAVGLYTLPNSKLAINPLTMKVTRLTKNGKVAGLGAISPDGRYVAYVMRGTQQSLWVKQIATGSEARSCSRRRDFSITG
jgi:eukaryotic-like serine/threonine-protein kinase